ncbi:MAG: phage major capsid protein [Streptomyces sp.]|uniref:phage major capsid protein n=1 Tax=Streptomyces sp. TaxID=1931 RepID=UPI0025EC1E5A|nr:phage major capsid protein [Streptomyces sp.]MBW8795903.1 phage major capsid protein [Streptomyces sp.]
MSTCEINERQAKAALEERAKLITEIRSIEGDNKLSQAEKRERVERIDRDVIRLEAEARDAVERGEREREVRALAANVGGLVMPRGGSGLPGDPDAWRSLLPSGNEFRTLVAEGSPGAGGYAVPSITADKYVEHLRAASVFLRVPGINVHRFEGGSFVLPNLTSSTTPGVVAEGAVIPEGTANFAGLTFNPVKYADLYRASNEVLDDAAFEMRNLIAGVMVRNIATQVDKDAFQGTGTASLSGLTKAGMGTAVNLTTGNTVVKWDHIIDGFSDIEAAGAVPGVIWASPDMGKALRKERENATTGGYLAGQVTDPVTKAGLGLPIYISANLPVRTVIVADPTRIHIGVRSDVRVAVSEDFGFDKDLTAFRATYRVAGLAVDTPAALQVVKASAS